MGLRLGEIQGLFWENYRDGEMFVPMRGDPPLADIDYHDCTDSSRLYPETG
jgi:hypothetical protein